MYTNKTLKMNRVIKNHCDGTRRKPVFEKLVSYHWYRDVFEKEITIIGIQFFEE